MTRWIKNRLTNIFTPKARATAPSNRFRPSMISLEDRTVPSGSDAFGGATLLTGAFVSDTGSNVGATPETGEPGIAGVPANKSVWWQWTAPSSGAVEINTFGSSFDTLLGVYTGSAVDQLTLVAESDDANSPQSQVLFNAVAGTTYRIAVDGFPGSLFGDEGDILLHVGMTPANDSFAGAIAVSGGTVTGHNLATTSESGEPIDVVSGEPNTVWWTWTAAEGGAAEINTFGSDFDTRLAVYRDTSPGTPVTFGELALVVMNDDADDPNDPNDAGLQSQALFAATAGTTYYVVVDGFLSETGAITLSVPAAQPPSNDPPVIDAQSFSVAENSNGGTVVGTVAASDPNGHSLMYSITAGNESGTFSINPTTGQIQVLNNAALNFEANPSFALTVQVTDNGSPALSNSATVTINLTNVNEAPTVGPAGPFTIAENSASGTVVGSVPSADPDAGDTRSYSIVGGDGTFAINSSTGQITVANNAALDFETSPMFAISVQVTDVGGLTATTSVTINLSDVNEGTPAAQFQNLMNMVNDLLTSGDLTTVQASSLQKKLSDAQKQYEKGNIMPAENKLMNFINEVNLYVSLGDLTQEQGKELTDAAQFLIDSI